MHFWYKSFKILENFGKILKIKNHHSLVPLANLGKCRSFGGLDNVEYGIYATTWLGSQHGILRLLNPFDIWIIEDSDWISEPATLCSLILCKKFIMVGKARNSVSEIEGYDGSDENLFQRLARIYKDEISQLR